MKYLIILGDGMADEKIPELGNMTPLEYAETPYMDLIAQHSRMGMLKTVPEGFHPGLRGHTQARCRAHTLRRHRHVHQRCDFRIRLHQQDRPQQRETGSGT